MSIQDTIRKLQFAILGVHKTSAPGSGSLSMLIDSVWVLIDLPKGFEGSQCNLEELQGFQVHCKSVDTPQTLPVKLSEIWCLDADLLQGLEGLQRSVSLSEVSQAVAKELHRVAFHSHIL